MKIFGFNKNRVNISSAPNREIDVLAPRLLEKKEHSAYHCVEELRLALNHPDCLNIALTGGYGSGKSSVIKTFLHEDGKKYNCLKISLSNFIDQEEKAPEKEKDYENQIESKIFQHIIYKADYFNTSKSNYKRIPFVSRRNAVVNSLLILVFALCFVIAFEPVCLQVNAFYDVYHKLFRAEVGYWINIVFDILSMIYMFLFVGHIIAIVCRRFKPMTIKSITAKEVSLDFESGKSAFKELLGEILYFFKAGSYDLVIFEDLDRINNPQKLFLKFREINQLLNESEDYLKEGKKVRFLYAIRDDVFSDEVRTKCFDYMIPVVPVIDKFNAGDYMVAHHKSSDFDQVDLRDIMALGMFIGTMRELTNVINEYRVFKNVLLLHAMSQTKLLASIIYKNAYPCDYADFHLKKGYLYAVLQNKLSFAKILTKEDDDLLLKLDDDIKNYRSSIVSLRREVLGWLELNNNAEQLIINEDRYQIDDIAEKDDLYDLFVNNKFDHYYYETHDEAGVIRYELKFSDIIQSIDGGEDTYYESMDENERQLARARQKRTDCINRIALTTSLSFRDIIAKIGNADKSLGLVNGFFANNVNDSEEDSKVTLTEHQFTQARLIHTLIKNGYIDEDLDAYVSFTYPGSKSSVDFEFLHSVLQGISKPYDFKLDHPDEVIKSLHTGNMSSKEVLNYDLVECLLKRNDEALKQACFKTIRNNMDFVVKYYETNRLTQSFADALFYKWDNCVDSIIRQLTEGSDILFELLFMAASQTCKLKSSELSILSDKYEFICQHIGKLDTRKVKSFIHYYRITFTSLSTPTEKSKTLFDYVTKHSYFEINYKNLKLIYGEDFDKCSYTCIIKGDKKIEEYIQHHIVDTVDLFPETDKEEGLEAIANLSNVIRVSDESFEKFLRRQNNIMPDFEQVRKDRIPSFIKTDKVKATWTNIKKFFEVDDDIDVVIPFIIGHYLDLAGTKLDEDEDKQLQKLLMCDNTLPLDVYQALLPCFGYYFEPDEIKNLDEDRLRVVLEADYIKYNQESKEFYASKDANLFGEFLVHFFDDFKKDKSFGVKVPNETGIQILNSHLTIEQKKYFIDNLACPLAEDGLDEYSNLICYYYSKMPIDDNTSVSTIINALDMSNDKTGWKQKIDLINRINKVMPYNETREKALLHSLGGEYLNLNSYRGVSHFDDNEENRKLLYYLWDKGHYVSKIKEDNGSLKVTFKNPPSED